MSNKKRGKLVVIEGGVGCGKTTQIKLLKKNLKNWEFYRYPGSTEYGEKVRDAIQGIYNYKVNEYAAAFGYASTDSSRRYTRNDSTSASESARLQRTRRATMPLSRTGRAARSCRAVRRRRSSSARQGRRRPGAPSRGRSGRPPVPRTALPRRRSERRRSRGR